LLAPWVCFEPEGYEKTKKQVSERLKRGDGERKGTPTDLDRLEVEQSLPFRPRKKRKGEELFRQLIGGGVDISIFSLSDEFDSFESYERREVEGRSARGGEGRNGGETRRTLILLHTLNRRHSSVEDLILLDSPKSDFRELRLVGPEELNKELEMSSRLLDLLSSK